MPLNSEPQPDSPHPSRDDLETGKTPDDASRLKKSISLILRLSVSVAIIVLILQFIPFQDRIEIKTGDGATQVRYGTVEHHDPEARTLRFQSEGETRTYNTSNLKFFEGRPFKPGLIRTWSRMNIPYALTALCFLPLLYFITAYRWKLLLTTQGIRIHFWKAFQFTWIGIFWNNVAPGMTGGDVAKAYMIGKNLNRKTGGLLSVFVDRGIGLFGLLLLAFLASLFKLHEPPVRNVGLSVLGLSLFVAVGIYVFYHPAFRGAAPVRWLKERLPFQDLIRKGDQAFKLFLQSPVILLKSIGLSLVGHTVGIVICAAYGYALGITAASPLDYFVYYPAATAISAIPISFRGWGIGEASYVYLFGLTGVPAASALSLSIMVRLTLTLWSFPGGLLMVIPIEQKELITEDPVDNREPI